MLQTLLLLGFVINKLNSHKMRYFIQDKLLKIYFPQFERFNMETNWQGKIVKVFHASGEQLSENDHEMLITTREAKIQVAI